MIEIVLPGDPVPWSVARVHNNHAYSPKAKEKFYAKVRVKGQYKDPPLTGPISLRMQFFMPIPKSFSKKKRAGMNNACHVCKPDTTNLQKFAEDCLTGIVIADDKQVWRVFCEKLYSETPKTIIQVIPT